MRKWILLVVLIGTLLTPAVGYAGFISDPSNVSTITRYVSWRNEYRTDFAWPSISQWDTMRVYFETPSGVPYDLSYPQSQASPIFYLTCNGTYQYFFESGGSVRYWTKQIVTTSIINPPCSSYGEGGGSRNDAGAYYSQNGNGGYDVFWGDIPGAASYDVWKDGELIGTVPAGGGSYNQTIPGTGGVSIVGMDGNGNYVGHSDLQVPEYTGQDDWGDGGGQNGCGDVCQRLKTLLECPEWDTYLGDLTGAIRAALPPPPDWPAIADVFVSAYAEYFGDVPTPPSRAEIEQAVLPSSMPVLDTSVPQVTPSVPDAYNTPVDFDITQGGPVFDVVDGSEPFDILEPDANLVADDPGVMVYPADPRNHSDGIKEPDTWQSPYEMPVPSSTSAPGEPIPSIPPSDMPVPSSAPGTVPIPSVVPGVGPTPTN